MPSRRRSGTKWIGCLGGILGVVLVGVAIAPSLTIRGVPVPILIKFLADQPARDAYFADDKPALHDRLQQLNVENEIKEFYRPQFSNERQLDQYIHQIFYDATGYIGKSYVVTPQGNLRLKNFGFEAWAKLAQQAGLITDSYYGKDGVPYIVGKGGDIARYDTIAPLYPKAWLNKQIKIQRNIGVPLGK